jgi:hypothetical protein
MKIDTNRKIIIIGILLIVLGIIFALADILFPVNNLVIIGVIFFGFGLATMIIGYYLYNKISKEPGSKIVSAKIIGFNSMIGLIGGLLLCYFPIMWFLILFALVIMIWQIVNKIIRSWHYLICSILLGFSIIEVSLILIVVIPDTIRFSGG